MKRIIIDYAKLTTDILDLLVEKYPDGYGFSDVITFKNAKGESIKAVEVKTEDAIFLVKISSKLEQTMEDYADDEDSFDSDDFDLDTEIDENQNDF
ncbi:MAG: hypothetical protein P8H13_04885 [Polaribacter sp.]|nr:hypothetical protein [Polaribacter sp.]MDG1811256.1 hypothetical protein [Polaribacter sp.]MDG1993823.1 hypothetical protein [Polaribacter sp.]